MDTINFKILKYNPKVDKTPYYKDYTVEAVKGATLLDTLNNIKWTQDGTLTFRMSCRSAICGSCAMKVNGRTMLACKTQVSSVVRESENGVKEVRIEPMKNMKVIKDLAVDMEPFWNHVESIMPWLKPENDEITALEERRQSIDDFHKIDYAANCIMCGSCYSDCTVLEIDKDYLGPAALSKAQRFVEDSRDGATNERLKEQSRKCGIWDCTHCFECVEACPKDVKPMERIMHLRTLAMNEGIVNNNGARHAVGFYKLVKESGLLDEGKIPLLSINIFNLKELFGLIPVGLRMLFNGKLPPLIHKPIVKHNEIKSICTKMEKQ